MQSKQTTNQLFEGTLNSPLIIAEIAQAHDGSLGIAHSYIDLVAECGADAIKFQTHFATEESTEREQWRVKFSYEDDRRIDYWKRMEFTPEQWHGIKKHCDEVGLVFLSSAFSEKAFHLLRELKMPAWKIASGELSNTLLTDLILESGDPVMVSSGMSSWSDLDALVGRITNNGNRLAVFQCTSSYPTPMEKIGLNVVSEMGKRYPCPVGLSDHSGEIYPCLAAQTLGAQAFEVHVTFDKRLFGPDAKSSLDPVQLKELVRASKLNATMLSCPIDKDAMASFFKPQLDIFSRSLVVTSALPSGHLLTREDLAVKKPAGGLKPEYYKEVIGKTLKISKQKDDALDWSDFQ